MKMDKKMARQAYLTASHCFADHVSVAANGYVRQLMRETVRQSAFNEDEIEVNEIVEAVIEDFQCRLAREMKDLRNTATRRAEAYVDKIYGP